MESLNPINSPAAGSQQEGFMDQVSNKIDELRELRGDVTGHKERVNEFVDRIEQLMEPLSVLSEREVSQDPEINQILTSLDSANDDLKSLEDQVHPNNARIHKL